MILELDGRGSHTGDRGFEYDRDRDAALLAAGWRTVRVAARQLNEAPKVVVGRIRTLLDVAPA